MIEINSPSPPQKNVAEVKEYVIQSPPTSILSKGITV